jgi:hypothetical protein
MVRVIIGLGKWERKDKMRHALWCLRRGVGYGVGYGLGPQVRALLVRSAGLCLRSAFVILVCGSHGLVGLVGLVGTLAAIPSVDRP